MRKIWKNQRKWFFPRCKITYLPNFRFYFYQQDRMWKFQTCVGFSIWITFPFNFLQKKIWFSKNSRKWYISPVNSMFILIVSVATDLFSSTKLTNETYTSVEKKDYKSFLWSLDQKSDNSETKKTHLIDPLNLSGIRNVFSQ